MASEFIEDLMNHKHRVAKHMHAFADRLQVRAHNHDDSKLGEEEYHAYEKAFPELQKHAYGTEEYKTALLQIQPAIEHHYQCNDHHPEFFERGIDDMNLMQIVEMVCDWMAASDRSKTDLRKGLKINQDRFHISPQLMGIIERTIIDLRGEQHDRSTTHP